MEIATFGGGCFWGVEHVFQRQKGVLKTTCGYMGGCVPNPSYEEVCSDRTGHAEVVQIEFDPNLVSFRDLCEFFWSSHDPTTPNRQGNDVGTQYRSIVFFHSPEQEAALRAMLDEMRRENRFSREIVTHLCPAQPFYTAEEYHQQYFDKHPEKLSNCPIAGGHGNLCEIGKNCR